MERDLMKRFQDERLRRVINNIDNIEDLRKLCLKIYEAKTVQEQVMLKMLFNTKKLSQSEIERLLPRPSWPGEPGPNA
jgi:hypothetical protein